MARLSHLFLVVLVLCSSLLAVALAVDAAESPVPKESAAPAQRRVKISQQDYPYGKPKEATGVKFSEYQSLAVPPYILVAVLGLFMAAAAYVIYKIFDTQQEKGLTRHSLPSLTLSSTQPVISAGLSQLCLCSSLVVALLCWLLCRAEESGEGQAEGGQEAEGKQEGKQKG